MFRDGIFPTKYNNNFLLFFRPLGFRNSQNYMIWTVLIIFSTLFLLMNFSCIVSIYIFGRVGLTLTPIQCLNTFYTFKFQLFIPLIIWLLLKQVMYSKTQHCFLKREHILLPQLPHKTGTINLTPHLCGLFFV